MTTDELSKGAVGEADVGKPDVGRTHAVLIIEDEDDLREMMREALELNGYCVVTAREGSEALERLSAMALPCLIFLDLLMPGMNGWDFFARMRERPELASVPVIVHSSAPSRAPGGVTRVLQKPVDLRRLISTVQEYCTH
jgi:CheY-like chemotaxis protein